MKINLDGTIIVDKGETLPFICPKCHWPIQYDKNLIVVNCFHCGYIDTVDKFSEATFDDEIKHK